MDAKCQTWTIGLAVGAALAVSSAAHAQTTAGQITSYQANLLGYWPMQTEGVVQSGRVQDFSLNHNHALVNSITAATPEVAASGPVDYSGALTFAATGPNGGRATVFPGGGSSDNVMQNNIHLEPGLLYVGRAGGSSGSFDASGVAPNSNRNPKAGDPNASPTPTVSADFTPQPGANPKVLLSGPAGSNYYISGATYQSGGAINGQPLVYSPGTQETFTGGLTGQSQMTMLMWAKMDAYDPNSNGGFGQMRGDTGQGWGLKVGGDGTVTFQRRNLDTSRSDAVARTPTDNPFAFGLGAWRFIAVTFDPAGTASGAFDNRVKFYTGLEGDADLTALRTAGTVSNQDWGSDNASAGTQPAAREFSIGGRQTGRAFDGEVAHFALLNTALSQAQLEAIFDGDTGITPGDTDLDGDVDLSDLGNLATYYAAAGNHVWMEGDFDADNDVDLSDLGTLATYYGAGQAQAFADFQALTGLSVPEPTSALSLLGLGGALALRRRMRA